MSLAWVYSGTGRFGISCMRGDGLLSTETNQIDHNVFLNIALFFNISP